LKSHYLRQPYIGEYYKDLVLNESYKIIGEGIYSKLLPDRTFDYITMIIFKDREGIVRVMEKEFFFDGSLVPGEIS